MNRIREIREAQGLTQEQLAERAGTTAATISRLETQTRQLTLDWMRRIAQALRVRPEVLIASAALAQNESDVEPYFSSDRAVPSLSGVGVALYRVIHSPLPNLGIAAGDVLLFETGASRPPPRTGDVVLVRILGDYLVLRQFLEPGLLTTNQPGANVAFTLDDPAFVAEIVGIRARP